MKVTAEFAEAFGAEFAATNEASDSPFDAVLIRDRRVVAVAEVKARDMTLSQLKGFRSYLITADKIRRGRTTAFDMRVPYMLVVGLLDAIVYWRVSDSEGTWRVKFKQATTRTRATCNGGEAVRENAYIELDDMKVLSVSGFDSEERVGE